MNKSNSQQIITFGCKLNFYESQLIQEKLAKDLSKNPHQEMIVVNSCAVTQEAERKVQKSIKTLKKRYPHKKIIVTGCAAQKDPKKFSEMIEVSRVIGNELKFNTDLYLFHDTDTDKKIFVNEIFNKKISQKFLDNNLITNFEKKTRAFVQVQNGCNRRCTFCIIPQLRGNNSSVPISAIVEQVQNLINNGYKEIVLTGVNVTSYGNDLEGEPSFAQMLRRLLLLVPNLKRLRLSSIDLGEIDEELFELLCSETRIMPHIHLSLQSGNDIILKRMKRRHNRLKVIEFCKKLRKFREEVAFGADIIAGFPTETEKMFQNTKDLISEAGLQYVHVFPYSPRENTPASRMPQLDKGIIKLRASILRKVAEEQLINYYIKYIGKELEVLIENNSISHTNNFIPVKFTQDKIDNLIGQIVKVKVHKIVDNKYMAAKII